MDLIQLTTPTTYHLRAGSNAGLVVQDGRALLVDTGLDRDAARRILKHVSSLNAEVAAVIVTHAHADHFGGAGEVKKRTGAPVLAPAFEAAVIENPALEPVYLFSGAQPPSELQGKFILAPGCEVDGLVQPGRQTLHGFDLDILPAPGHAHNQMIVGCPEASVCFAADAFFAPAVLDKYGVPFYVDVDQALETLTGLPALPYGIFAQGHGDAYPQADLAAVVAINLERIQHIRQLALAAVEEPQEASQVLKAVADELGVAIMQPAIYYLTRTTIHACLNSLRQSGRVDIQMIDNRLLWVATG